MQVNSLINSCAHGRLIFIWAEPASYLKLAYVLPVSYKYVLLDWLLPRINECSKHSLNSFVPLFQLPNLLCRYSIFIIHVDRVLMLMVFDNTLEYNK